MSAVCNLALICTVSISINLEAKICIMRLILITLLLTHGKPVAKDVGRLADQIEIETYTCMLTDETQEDLAPKGSPIGVSEEQIYPQTQVTMESPETSSSVDSKTCQSGASENSGNLKAREYKGAP